MKTIILLLVLALADSLRAQIPVTDVANLANNRASQIENLAKWVESIGQLKTQIDQLKQQISLQSDLRKWAGDPKAAGTKIVLDALGATDLVKEYGRAKDVILATVKSLDSLKNTAQGSYRAITDFDIDGNELKRDALMFRRYAVLDATQANTEQVAEETKAREGDLQEEISATLDDLKSADTGAEAQKQAAKLIALNGQLAQVEAARKRGVDAFALQKMANDARLEQERLAAAELAGKDDYVAIQRISGYMKKIKVR
jgi:hypothetical protein